MGRPRDEEHETVQSDDHTDLPATLLKWLNMPIYRDKRRFLEKHLKLLNDESLAILAALIEQYDGQREQQANLREQLRLLQDARRCGATVQAVRTVYVDAHGGLVLDVPDWLEGIEQRLRELRASGRPDRSAAARTSLLNAAIMRAQNDHHIPPEVLASLHIRLWEALDENISSANRETREDGIASLHAALRVYRLDHYPQQYAMIHGNLGIAYWNRIEGERRANLEEAIHCYHEALRVYTYDAFPVLYAKIQSNLGLTYGDRIEGERRTNLEEAIGCYREALQVLTYDDFSEDYATTQNNLGIAYRNRIKGERRTNLEEAIGCYREALRVYTYSDYPVEHARIQNNLGLTYGDRIEGERRTNLEEAIGCYREALRVLTYDDFPINYAAIQNNLGNAYSDRIAGERRTNLEIALYCYHEALRIRTYEALPVDYASTQNNLGLTYSDRIEGDRQANQENAMRCFEEALRVYTFNRFPIQYRATLLNRALVQADQGNWAGLADTCAKAMDAEDLLVSLAGGIAGQTSVLQRGHSAAVRGGFALAKMGRLGEAAVLLERGRARGIAAALALDLADPKQVSDPIRRERYIAARNTLRQAQNNLNMPIVPQVDAERLPKDANARAQVLDNIHRQALLDREAAFRQAKATFDAIVSEICSVENPTGFLQSSLDEATILQAAQHVGSGHALVYLLTTPWGGLAIAALNSNPAAGTVARFAALSLPQFTSHLIDDLIESHAGSDPRRVLSGFGLTQEGSGFALLLQNWPGGTLREKATVLHQANVAEGAGSTFEGAMQALLEIPECADLAVLPLEQFRRDTQENRERLGLLNNTFFHLLLRLELDRCLTALSDVALRKLAGWLREEGATGITLIPCGALAAFPLAAAEVAPGMTLGEWLPTSVAPSARALLQTSDTKETEVERAGVYAVGDPRPTHQPLGWSEAESLTVARLARTVGLSGEAKVQIMARRSWLIEKLQSGLVVDIACHGTFNSRQTLDSTLLLASHERLTLRDMISHTVELRGLRLSILSACQTAILDLRGARDEVRSLATAMYQAGAKAILAALWSVDDRATYLLIVRFAQIWLPRMDSMPPAEALAQAQHWLRTCTWADLAAWDAQEAITPTESELHDAGSDIGVPSSAHTPEDPKFAAQSRLATVRGRGSRLVSAKAEQMIREMSQGRPEMNQCPYADPIYWAAFQITGW